MSAKRRVVVTGLGVGTPMGIGIEPFWHALTNGDCGLKRIELFDPAGFPSQIAGELPPFKLGDFIPKNYRKSIKVMSRDIQIAVACAYHAVKDAGLITKCIVDREEEPGPPNLDSTRFGANIGAGLICADLSELAGALATARDESDSFDIRKWGSEGMQNLTPLWLLKFLPNMLACHVTIVHDCQAPSNTITCGEASSPLAIGEAFRTIARGDADVCICGGAEAKTNPMALARPLLLGQLNCDANGCPGQAYQPFGRHSRGAVAAEGGGLVILESLAHAQARGARIYAEMAGFGAGSNVYHWAKPDPEGKPVALALKNAVADAGLTCDDVDLAVPFGVGIAEYDSAEARGWNSFMGDRLGDIPALTTRPGTGFNGAGCGAIDFAAMVMSVHTNTVPPTPNTAQQADESRFRFRQKDPQDAKIRSAVTVGYALAGGQAAALVIKRFEE